MKRGDLVRTRVEAILRRALERYRPTAASPNEAPLHARPSDDWFARLNHAKREIQGNRLSEAIVILDGLIAERPAEPSAYVSKATCLLLLGNLEEGWPLYEWRWFAERQRWSAQFGQDFHLWTGDCPLDGKTVLLLREQGFGDMIQFSRYVPLLEDLGAKVILQTQPPLAPFLATISNTVTIVESGKPPPPSDYFCPTLSLPLALRTTIQSIPTRTPYLYPNKEKQARWKELLGMRNRRRVGLCWAGTAGHANDANRSMRREHVTSLFDLPLDFHVLHKDLTSGDLAHLKKYSNVTTHFERIEDFSDTASLIAELDLVISVDTAVAHVAGALGRPVWVLLPFAPDWRWLLNRSDSPWYPTAQLVRQPSPGAWLDVVATVRDRLVHSVCSAD